MDLDHDGGARPGASGRCLCGAVRYRVTGPLRDVVICHCRLCQRMNTHVGAYASCAVDDLQIEGVESLRWHCATPLARRGFCVQCGSALFWEPVPASSMAISAGSLDEPTGLKVIEHICVDEQGDYYAITDGLPRR